MISSIVDTLSDFSITVVSACCDNCKSNVKALNQDEDSAQEMCQSSFIRQPCSAHTANLGIKDLFSKNKKYNYVKKVIKKLMSNKPEGSFRLGFEPKLETIRWKSLFKCVSFINENYELYEKSNNFEVLDSLYTIKEIIGWHNLNEVL